MQIKIEGLDDLKKSLGYYGKQLPFALSKALNDTVYGAREALTREIKDSFDHPTPVVQKGVLYTKATKHHLAAEIYLSRGETGGVDIESILTPHIRGGRRILKASERRLRRFGFMGNDQWLTPGPGAPLDRYGNISASNMSRILGQLQAFQEAGYNRQRKQRRTKSIGTLYWIARVGVFRRIGPNQSIPVLFFTNKAPHYEKRFDFFFVVRTHIEKNFHKNFQAALQYAIRTAR